MEVQARGRGRTASNKQLAASELADYRAVHWGLFGASMVDNQTLTSEMPRAIAKRFNVTARSHGDLPRIHSWDELRKAFGQEKIDEIRKDISFGMQIRMASKYFNIPFLAAAEVVYGMDNAPKAEVKAALSMIRAGKKQAAVRKYGDLAEGLSRIVAKYRHPDNRRIAIDQAAKNYWETYYGPFGEELVAEVKKRVRADLASSWLRKHGVDQAAADYWSTYYGEYGDQWVSVVPKKISPSKN